MSRFVRKWKFEALQNVAIFSLTSWVLTLALLTTAAHFGLVKHSKLDNIDFTGTLLTLAGIFLGVKSVLLGMSDRFANDEGDVSYPFTLAVYQTTFTSYFAALLGLFSFLRQISEITLPTTNFWSSIGVLAFPAGVITVFLLVFKVIGSFAKIVDSYLISE